jgi:hypothetical protein
VRKTPAVVLTQQRGKRNSVAAKGRWPKVYEQHGAAERRGEPRRDSPVACEFIEARTSDRVGCGVETGVSLDVPMERRVGALKSVGAIELDLDKRYEARPDQHDVGL